MVLLYMLASWSAALQTQRAKEALDKERTKEQLIMETLRETRKGYSYIEPSKRSYEK
jgi:hypothetical protein